MIDARETSRAWAKEEGARTSRALMHYRGQDVFDFRARLERSVGRLEVHANRRYLHLNVAHPSGIVFATPVVDALRRGLALHGQVGGHDVYVMGDGRAQPGRWLHRPDVVRALAALRLTGDELLSVGIDGATALLRSHGLEEDRRRLQTLFGLIDLFPVDFEPRLDISRIPPDLRDLVPLIEQWGIADDAARSDMIDVADSEALSRLVGTVGPRLNAIREHLGDRDLSSTEEGSALDALAQSVMEAQRELARRA